MMDLYFKKPYASDILYSSRNKKKAAPVLLSNNEKIYRTSDVYA